MADTDFDIIIIGSGCAGATAAYVAASAGKSVLVVERGEYAGAKNMTGGRIYAHSIEKVFPDFVDEAPVERKITHERMAMVDSKDAVTVDFTSAQLAEAGNESYSVLCAPFDQWLAGKAEHAGAEYIYGIAVEELLKDGYGRIVGIKAGDDEITAQVTIVAEGVNSLLAEKYLGASRPTANQMAVGIKEVYELSADQIASRFLCPEGEGAAMLFVGDCTHGHVGGGFLYTNKESISLGLVATISDAASSDNVTPVYQMLDDFKKHPVVAPIIAGAKLAEHSGHMVAEGGWNMVPELVHDGALVAGDAGMLCMNLGYQVRGMDLAVESGRLAAEAAVVAIDAGDVSKTGLASYRQVLDDSFVMKDMRTFRRWPAYMEKWDRLFKQYPALAKDVLNVLFVVDGTPQQPLKARMMPIIKKMGIWSLLREVRGALKAI